MRWELVNPEGVTHESKSEPTKGALWAAGLGLLLMGAPALGRLGSSKTLITELVECLLERKPTIGALGTLAFVSCVFCLTVALDSRPKQVAAGGCAAVLLVFFSELFNGSSHNLLGIEAFVVLIVLGAIQAAATCGGFVRRMRQ